VLGGLGGAFGAAALGCSDSESTPGGQSSSATTGAGASSSSSGGAGVGGSSSSSGGQGGGGGAGGSGTQPSCTDLGGFTPEQLLAKVDTIVVLMMENRSFDHYFGSLSLLEGKTVDGLTGAESNLDPGGTPVDVFQLADETPADPPHGWDASHAQWNMGAMDGFVSEHAGPDQAQVMGYHLREQLPALYGLADAYALCERWFCSVLGPTWPNRFYLHGATSKGTKGNQPIFGGFTTIFDRLADAGLSHKNYFHDVAWSVGGYLKTAGNAGIESFFSDAAAGTLPNFSVIDPQFFGPGANDDHPDHDITLGQALIASIYEALAQSPQWNRSMLVITYDEHGGFFDHVAPPTTVDSNAEFAQLGVRVPGLVIGPFARKGCVVSTTFEHVSVISTATRRWGLAPLNDRVTATEDLSSCLDPAYLDDPQPPVKLPAIDVSMSRLRARERGPQRVHQPELWEMAELGLIPRHLDRRAQGPEITRAVLEWGRRLGAVRLVD
jgi:phospholipase C